MDDFTVMRCQDLKESEIDYELKIRDLQSKKDLASKIKCLRRAIQKNTPLVLDYSFKLADEKQEVDKDMTDIESFIQHLDGSVITRTETHFKAGRSRLVHISNRVGRVLSRASSPEAKQYVAEWRAMILELESDLMEKTVKIIDNQSGPSAHLDAPRLSLLNTSGFPSTSSPKSVPVYKWGVHFDGRGDLLSFLERVSDLMIARGITPDELFNSAYDLFEGPALTWYRSIRDTVSSWDELSRLLKTSFLPSDNDDALWEEIRGRKQVREETVLMFVAHMNTLFSRLTHVPNEKSKLNTIRRNLLSYYISALALEDIDSLDELVKLCKRLDEAYKLKKQNLPPKNRVLAVQSGVAAVPISSPRASISNSVCWNCRQEGHTFSTCPSERKRFCFRCGAPDVTVRACPRCNPHNQGNA